MDFLKPYINQAMPHLKNAAAVACVYGDRIVTRLDMILEAVATPEYAEYHPRQGFVFAGAGTFDMAQVPAGEIWELEFITVLGTATVSINEGADPVRYAKLFTTADAQPGLGLIFGGGTAPTITASAACTVAMQFGRRKVKPAMRSNAPGMIESPDIFNGQVLGERSNDGRHSNTAGVGPNIRGAARGDGYTHPEVVQ